MTATLTTTIAAKPDRRGESTVAKPVAVTWVTCINACFNPDGTPVGAKPVRNGLVALAMRAGVAYYTARTQVHLFLKASAGGTVMPEKLPQGVTLA
jgi:hypothetical protein